MRSLFFIISTLFISSAYALGPIPNGKYSGKMNCVSHNRDYNSESDNVITITDTRMDWVAGDQSSDKEFIFDELGFFQIKSADGVGQGYTSGNALHFEFTLSMGDFNVHGEDTLFYLNKKLHLISSAMIMNDLIKCEGIFDSN